MLMLGTQLRPQAISMFSVCNHSNVNRRSLGMKLLESYLLFCFHLPSLSCMKTVVLTFSNPVRLNINSVNDSSPSKVSSSMIIIVAVYTEGSTATIIICIINHTLPSTIRAVISTLTCTSMASNSTSDSKCYQAVRVQVRVLLLP